MYVCQLPQNTTFSVNYCKLCRLICLATQNFFVLQYKWSLQNSTEHNNMNRPSMILTLKYVCEAWLGIEPMILSSLHHKPANFWYSEKRTESTVEIGQVGSGAKVLGSAPVKVLAVQLPGPASWVWFPVMSRCGQRQHTPFTVQTFLSWYICNAQF